MPRVACPIAWSILLMLAARPLAGQERAVADTAALQRLLVAEDARGTGAEGVGPLLEALGASDSLLRRVAVRGVGRLQRPDLGRRLLPLLTDSLPAVRAEAANAVAQSMRRVRRDAAVADSAPLTTPEAAAALARALAGETDAVVADALAQSLGRLLLPDSAAAREAEGAIRGRLEAQATPGVVHGLYTLARARRATGPLDHTTVVLLRRTAVTAADTATRRLALLALAATGGLDSLTAEQAGRDPDAGVRRTMLRGVAGLSRAQRAALVRRALADADPIVRTEAVSAARGGEGPPDCAPLAAATHDAVPHVALTAVDSLGGGCADTASAVRALRAASERRVAGPADHRWQLGAHALVSLARLDATAAATLLSAAVASPRPEARQYAARAAATLADRPTLYRLAADLDHNVQEAALVGLAATAGHEADTVYIRALASPGFQVVLAASQALKGSTHPDAVPALVEAFRRLGALRSENARDPRMALLERIGEAGRPDLADRLTPYLADFDTTVAATVAGLLTRWTGAPARARPVPLPLRPEALAATFLRRDVRLRVTMSASSGGGTFIVRLFPAEAPATVARVLRLARERYYDGHAFQRVEPNFVVQGGGPDANEYVGDVTFMRDELTRRPHARGTVGISARGRDTGDAQWFINLVDNPLLDHEYTIFGRIVAGRAVAERILEGDRIARIDVIADR